MRSEDDLPFPLAYLDWCKERGIKSIKDAENLELIHTFYYEVWGPAGKEVDGLEYAIARGMR